MIPSFGATEFGAKFKEKETTPISKILEDFKSYQEKEVVISGMVTNVCSMRGCWMEFASDKQYQTLRIKVQDGDMVFPLSAKGKSAIAKGKLSSKTYTKDELIAMEKERIEYFRKKGNDKGVIASEERIAKINGPKTFHQFIPSGVRID